MLQPYINKLTSNHNLTEEEMYAAMDLIMNGKISDAQLAAFIVALKMKGETVEEISAAVQVMREKSSKLNAVSPYLIDTCGTGGDIHNTFNISTAAAFVAAGAGAVVAKHGNRAVTSKCGSADVLKTLGVNIDIPIEKVEDCIKETGIGFLFAPIFHFAMKYAAGVRKELGIRTIFNILGPMTNPAGATQQIIGVFSLDFAEKMASVLARLGTKHALLFCGDGLDEISIMGTTRIAEVKNGKVNKYGITPEDFNLPSATLQEIAGGDLEENARIIRSIFNGEKGAKRDIVLLNAGAAIYTSGKADSHVKGVELAAKSLDSGAAAEKLDQLIKVSNS